MKCKVNNKIYSGLTVFKLDSIIVHGPESEIIHPPGGIFVDPHIFVVWTLAFKYLVVGWKIDAVCGHNKLVSLATHAIFNERLQCITEYGVISWLFMYLNQLYLCLNIRECLKNKLL